MTEAEYDAAAWEYYQTLPMEHFMEATRQATQREIALESFALLKIRRSDVQYFSELLVQYPFEGTIRRVVPDNMLVISDEPDRDRKSYATELEPAPPYMMLEWVADSSEGKDYGESFLKYERELRTPYCLTYHPDKRDWRVYHHDGGERYVQLEPDLNGRVRIAELDLEIGLLDGWIRFWHQGELLEIPSELQERLDRQSKRINQQSKQISQQSEQISQQSEQIDQQTEQIDQQTKQIDQQTKQIDQQAERINELSANLGDIVERFRRLVEHRARQACRQDILDSLSSADFTQLEQWITEL
jgi:hypothetical protein